MQADELDLSISAAWAAAEHDLASEPIGQPPRPRSRERPLARRLGEAHRSGARRPDQSDGGTGLGSGGLVWLHRRSNRSCVVPSSPLPTRGSRCSRATAASSPCSRGARVGNSRYRTARRSRNPLPAPGPVVPHDGRFSRLDALAHLQRGAVEVDVGLAVLAFLGRCLARKSAARLAHQQLFLNLAGFVAIAPRNLASGPRWPGACFAGTRSTAAATARRRWGRSSRGRTSPSCPDPWVRGHGRPRDPDLVRVEFSMCTSAAGRTG